LTPAVAAEAEMPVIVMPADGLRPGQPGIPSLTIPLIIGGEPKSRSNVVNGLIIGNAELCIRSRRFALETYSAFVYVTEIDVETASIS
jgi:hypothetical protein